MSISAVSLCQRSSCVLWVSSPSVQRDPQLCVRSDVQRTMWYDGAIAELLWFVDEHEHSSIMGRQTATMSASSLHHLGLDIMLPDATFDIASIVPTEFMRSITQGTVRIRIDQLLQPIGIVHEDEIYLLLIDVFFLISIASGLNDHALKAARIALASYFEPKGSTCKNCVERHVFCFKTIDQRVFIPQSNTSDPNRLTEQHIRKQKPS